MIKLYLKQAWQMFRDNRLVNTLSIGGTALSVAAVMLIVLIYQVQYASYAPESNRFRTLYLSQMHANSKGGEGGNNGSMGERVLRECLYSLKTPEAVTALCSQRLPISLEGQRLSQKYDVTFTDNQFWQVFGFSFLAGAPFTKADFDAALPRAVIAASVARKLFGTTDAVGKTFLMNYAHYKVCGVVDDVSKVADRAYAQVWMPYSVHHGLMAGTPAYMENTTGSFTACLLAHSSRDFDAIRNELKNVTARFNGTLAETEIDFFEGPYSQWERIIGANGNTRGDFWNWMRETGALAAFLLLLPALNIIGITMTQFRKRRGEIGIRKSFGAHFSTLIAQVLTENLLISCIGGAVGLLLSYAILIVCKPFLLLGAPNLSLGMLLKPETFLVAFVLTLILNLLCAGWPAWKAARIPVIQALNDVE